MKKNNLQVLCLQAIQNGEKTDFYINGRNMYAQFLEDALKVILFMQGPKEYLLKIEFIDNLEKQNLEIGFNIPIIPNYWRFSDLDSINSYLKDDKYDNLKKKVTLNTNEFDMDYNMSSLINYIQHEFALKYILAKKDKKYKLAKKLESYEFMWDFDLSQFSNSKSGRGIYKVPQIINETKTIDGESIIKPYYLGLQFDEDEDEKDASFYNIVLMQDSDYINLDYNFDRILAHFREKYSEMVADNNYLTPDDIPLTASYITKQQNPQFGE